MTRKKDTGNNCQYKTAQPTATYTSPASITFVSSNARRFMEGEDVANFHARKARGDILPHTRFVQTEWDGKFLGGHAEWAHVSNGQAADCPDWPGPDRYRLSDGPEGNDPTASADMHYAQYHVQRAAERIYTKGWDAMTFSAELPKLSNQLQSLAKRLGGLRRAPLKTLKRVRRSDILGTWMEGRYAYRTLALDLQDMHDAFTAFDEQRRIWSERSGYSYHDRETEEETLDVSFTSALRTNVVVETQHSFSVRGSVTALIEPHRIITNPITTAWELVPLSFVIDWVLDMGTFLNSVAFQASASQIACSQGYQCKSVRTITGEGSPIDNYTGSENFSYIITGLRQSREPTTINFKPQLTDRMPTGFELLDLTALTRAVFNPR